jgi:predicted 3-demethylubiquinone-9 3-methyltransferase (glyoxalase superfamily)
LQPPNGTKGAFRGERAHWRGTPGGLAARGRRRYLLATMQRITPFLWFDTQARQAAELYASSFAHCRIVSASELEGTPSGRVETLVIEISGLAMKLMSAGPFFTINPSVSFMVSCGGKEEVDGLWARLSPSGTPLMELGEYPFSARYGWIQDRFGVSWQLMLSADGPGGQRVTPTLMFVGDVCGKAEEAMGHYASLFDDSRVDDVMRYGEGEAPDRSGTVKHASFTLAGQQFAAMDSAHPHEFRFTEAVSFEIACRDQAEIDRFWKLSADPAAEQCGWLKDRYGLSWQVVPTALGEMLSDPDPRKKARVTRAFLAMKKFDLAALKAAAKG